VEAGQLAGGRHLGPVASAVLMEVFGAMLLHCGDSILGRAHKDWAPDPCITGGEELKLAHIASYVS